ncbi:hypothetical protein RYH80_00335 [Halobaculum sp. MBLA0147]|uniref:hypothetical protein n=1 Tax=Halobaculum sp. MBLA0147 TaxID=3079934 RepID=UPI0035232F73
MILSRHPEVDCRDCGERLYVGLSPEPSCWKVHYVCRLPDGCGRERRGGRIAVSAVDSRDEARRLAERRLSAER